MTTSKKDYNLVARGIRTAKRRYGDSEALDYLLIYFSAVFAISNPRFNLPKFEKACGYGEEEESSQKGGQEDEEHTGKS